MRSKLIRCTLGFLAVLSLSTPSMGFTQQPCSKYDDCSIRIENLGGFGKSTIVRGASGVPVGQVRLRLDDASLRLLTNSDSATRYARLFNSQRPKAYFYGLAAVAFEAAGVGLLGNKRPELGSASFLIGLGFSIGSQRASKTAENALAKAVWWFNRDLPN